MNTTENNKLIAEFMNYELCGKNTYEYNLKLYLIEDLKFNSDWNWLMLVVDEISENDFVDEFEINKCSVFGNITKITPSKNDTFESFYFDSSKDELIDVVYNTCVEFIKWYNQNK